MQDEDDYDWVANIAVMLNIISMMPQVWHVYDKQDARSLSYTWLATSIMANILWLFFGAKKKIKPVIISSLFFLGAFIVLGIMKYYFE